MTADGNSLVPVWALATTGGARLRALPDLEATMTPERLKEMRSALAAFAATPVVTLEAHPLRHEVDRSTGLSLDAFSPLAQELSRLVSQTKTAAPAVEAIASSREVLYRMVVPAKLAADVGKGLVKPMASKAAAGGVYSALVDSAGIAAQATFVPVEAGATGAAAGAVAGAATAGTLTIAAPLVLMAVAVGVSAYADQQRRKAIEHLTELLERLNNDNLDRERGELDGCRDAIDKATAILLDQGKVGASLGLDSAVHAIGKATEMARHRLRKWTAALDSLPDGPVDLSSVVNMIRGVDRPVGEFRAHLELAALAIALKRRVIILQAVDAAQSDPDNPFQHFVRSLKADEQRVDELELGIASVLTRLSSLQLRAPSRLRAKLMTRNEVDELLKTTYVLRELGEGIQPGAPTGDAVIDIVQRKDGTLLVLPASAA